MASAASAKAARRMMFVPARAIPVARRSCRPLSKTFKLGGCSVARLARLGEEPSHRRIAAQVSDRRGIAARQLDNARLALALEVPNPKKERQVELLRAAFGEIRP